MNISKINDQSIYYLDIPNHPVVEMLKRNKLYGQVMYNLIDTHLKPNSNILDIGSNFGTFVFVPANKNHQVFAVESKVDIQNCLRQTYKEYTNVSISESIPHISSSIDCIHFAEQSTLDNDINKCSAFMQRDQPIILMHVNMVLLGESRVKNVFNTLDSIDYHYFFYNAPNFFVALDKKQAFPFCEMVLIGMHNSSIINNIGRITYGEYLPNDTINSLIDANISNASDSCLEYLMALRPAQELS